MRLSMQRWRAIPWSLVVVLLSLHMAPLRADTPDYADVRVLIDISGSMRQNDPQNLRRPALRMLAGQFADFMIFVLIVAAIISGLVGDPQDTAAIIVIVLLNAIIGAVQEYRAERAVKALRALAAPAARVRRDGQVREVPAVQLVPGDIVLLEAGNVVPADLRLIEVAELRIDEAALTGESQAVEKHTDPLEEADVALGDRCNMGFKGTLVSGGRATGVVVATAMATQLGEVAGLLAKSGTQRTPLQRRLAQFGKRLSIAVLLVCAMIFTIGLLRGEPVALMFLTAVTLAVAAIPEALPAVVTVSLALGARKMSRRNALIRRLPAVETLGSVTYICADKTGTLTANKMQLDAVLTPSERKAQLPASDTAEPHWQRLGQALALNNDSHEDTDGKLSGDPTEIALYSAARDAGFVRGTLEKTLPRIAELPFDAERKRMTTLHQDQDGVTAFLKGAPERVLKLCVDRFGADTPDALDPGAVLEAAEALAGQGYRVLAFALRRLDGLPDSLQAESVEQGFSFLGLAGLIDPPRPEAGESVALCRSAGITPVMITGDHAGTARAIAEVSSSIRSSLPTPEDTI